MNVNDAIAQACSVVGIVPPRAPRGGKWTRTDTLSGKNGKGDGALIVDTYRVSARNWQTGEVATIWLKDRDSLTPVQKRQFAERKAKDDADHRRRADEAARVASRIVEAAKPSTHPYLARKGFPNEQVLVVGSASIARLAGEYAVAGERAIVMPARLGSKIASAQLIWEDGSKKFLAGGETSGASHRIAKGRDTWLCEGLATGLSLRAASKTLSRTDTILCCFSASNVAAVARSIEGRCFIAADNDKPMPHFEGLGTGEHWAKVAGKPYIIPPSLGDINDMHMSAGIFAVQKLISSLVRGQL